MNKEFTKYNQTIPFIFSRCSKRISDRIKYKGITQESIYPSNPSLVNHIVNCNCGKNNTYLLTPTITGEIDNSDNPKGLIHVLQFTKKELYWGTDEEIEEYLWELFRNLIYDLLDLDIGLDIDYILCDYIPYAKYSRYFKILLSTDVPLLPYYGIREDDVMNNIDSSTDKAIEYLFSKNGFKESFKNIFFKFIKKQTFFKIDTTLEKNFVKPLLLPLLKNYWPKEGSLGIRVKVLIESDLLNTKTLLLLHEKNEVSPFSTIARKLNYASSSYIIELEKIQLLEISTASLN